MVFLFCLWQSNSVGEGLRALPRADVGIRPYNSSLANQTPLQPVEKILHYVQNDTVGDGIYDVPPYSIGAKYTAMHRRCNS